VFSYIYSVYAINFIIVSLIGFYYFYPKVYESELDNPFLRSFILCITLYVFGPFICMFYFSTSFWYNVINTYISIELSKK
jgi:hypothetical protein